MYTKRWQPPGPVFSYTLRYFVGFWLAEMAYDRQTQDIEPMLVYWLCCSNVKDAVPALSQHWFKLSRLQGTGQHHTRHWMDVDIMLARSLRRRPNVSSILDKGLVITGFQCWASVEYGGPAITVTPLFTTKVVFILFYFQAESVIGNVWAAQTSTFGLKLNKI